MLKIISPRYHLTAYQIAVAVALIGFVTLIAIDRATFQGVRPTWFGWFLASPMWAVAASLALAGIVFNVKRALALWVAALVLIGWGLMYLGLGLVLNVSLAGAAVILLGVVAAITADQTDREEAREALCQRNDSRMRLSQSLSHSASGRPGGPGGAATSAGS